MKTNILKYLSVSNHITWLNILNILCEYVDRFGPLGLFIISKLCIS